MFNYKFWLVLFALLSGQISPAWALCYAPTMTAQSAKLTSDFDMTANPAEINLSADQVIGQFEDQLSLIGDAQVQQQQTRFGAQRIDFHQGEGLIQADTALQLERDGHVIRGSKGQFNLKTHHGFVDNPTYDLANNRGLGDASRLEILDKKHYKVLDARYSTCRQEVDGEWAPDWYIQSSDINLDFVNDVGVAKHGVLRFKGVPILYWPYFSFPLSKARKTGWLPPRVGLDSLSGVEFSQPFYWNIAPNYDATITTNVLSKRGVNLNNKFRFLTAKHSGEIELNMLPSDKLMQGKRWSLLANHQSRLFDVLGEPLVLNTHLNMVSDDNYWSDFAFLDDDFRRRILNNRLELSWQKQQWSAALRWQHWYALQNSSSNLIAPFDLSPQVSVRYDSSPDSPWLLNAELQASRFTTNDVSRKADEAKRQVFDARIGYDWRRPSHYLRSSVQLRHNNYQFKQATALHGRKASFTIPTLSLDGGVIFERQLEFKSKQYYQIFEPRLLYVYTPSRQQAHIPWYDTVSTDFNFNSIFSSNSYVGYDQVGEGNMLTLGFSSRYFDRQQGNQVLDLRLAQRVHFSKSWKGNDFAIPNNVSYGNLLFGARVNLTKYWSLDAAAQYDHDTNSSVNNSLMLQYNKSANNYVNLAYYRQNLVDRRMELNWRLDLDRRWREVARWSTIGSLQYDFKNRELSNWLVALEYRSCCWATKLGFEMNTRNNQRSNKRVVLQMELTGLRARSGI